MDIRIILNGKAAGLEFVRTAIHGARENGHVEVRVTWEGGDVRRLLQEARAEGCRRVVAGGGDGTVNEVVDAVLKLPAGQRPEIAILPLGTANDFAGGCGIPTEPSSALRLAQTGRACVVDGVRANEQHFINVASGGFGAQVTANTPVALKSFLGGGAYTLAGIAQALKFVPYKGVLRIPDGVFENEIIASAVCNGRQAGGGEQLAPSALIDDGMLDIVGLLNFPAEAAGQVIRELTGRESGGDYVKWFRVPWAEWECEVPMPINLDGESISADKVRFEVMPGAIKLVLPEDCPMTGGRS